MKCRHVVRVKIQVSLPTPFPVGLGAGNLGEDQFYFTVAYMRPANGSGLFAGVAQFVAKGLDVKINALPHVRHPERGR